MNFNGKEHSRFIRYLDRTAEKNPFLWLPCVVIIALALAAEHIAERANRRNAEKAVNNSPHLERKPFFLRAVAVTLTLAFSLMLVPVTSLNAFGEEYAPEAEQVIFDEMSEIEGTSDLEEMTVPEETTEPEEASEPEEITEPEEVTEPEETTEPEEVTEPEETTEPEEPTETEETEEPKEEEFPREENFVSENDFLLYGISTQATDHTGHNVHPKWSLTNEEHWRYCETCKEEFDRGPHSSKTLVGFDPPTADKQGYLIYQCVCGFQDLIGVAPTDTKHEYGDWESNELKHWKECKYEDCKFVNNIANHTMGAWQQYSPGSFYYSSYHYRKCTVCGDSEHGYIEEFVPHNWGDWQKDSSGHWRTCKDCGQEDRRAHNISADPKQWDYKYDDTQHWLECSVCGYQTGKTNHNINSDEWQHNNTHHRKGCTVCMYATEKEEHSLRWEQYDNDQKHKQVCDGCDVIINDGEHVWQWKKDEDKHYQKCAVCPEIKNESEHTFAKELASDNTQHWHECTYVIDEEGHTCGQKKDIAVHTPDYDTWHDDENYHWRECSECDHEVEKVKHNYTRYYDETTHWDVCDGDGGCGKKDHESFHSYSAPIYTYDEDGETPIKRYECVNCDYSYTVPVWHEHTFFDKLGYNELGHWYDCKYCRGKINSAYHDYTVKVTVQPTETSTGTRVYTCKACGYSYDEVIPEFEHAHLFGTEWCKDESEHWHECVCGEKSDIAPHVYGTDNICIICGYVMRTAVFSYSPRLPYITNVPEVRGWVNIAAYINASPDYVIIPITMNGEYKLPKKISECIMNRDVDLKINMDGGPVWTVNGLDVAAPKTVDLRVSERPNKIPADIIDGLISEFEPKEYRLYHGGSFGFKAALTLNVPKKYNDYYAELYHYNTGTKQLEFVDESLVQNRLVTFKLTHASYYAVTFSSIPMYDDISTGAGVFENSVPIETSAMPETGGVTIPAVKLPQIMKYSSRKRRYRILKKRRLDDLVFVF